MMNGKKEQNAATRAENAVSRIENLYQEMLNSTDSEYGIKFARQLLSLQKEDGSFSVIEDRRCDSDIIVAYVYFPTYYATAALMQYMLRSGALSEDIGVALHRGLTFAKGRGLNGHGFDATADKLKALEIFKRAGLYEWMTLHGDREPEFCEMISRIIEGFRKGLMTGRTWSDWNRDFRKEFEQEVSEFEDHMCPYVWYAAYGSNLCRNRFMEYINGCRDTREPEESKAFEIPYELYFAYQSRRWNGSGVAFVDDGKPGKTMGRIYKIRKEQFLEIQRMEGTPYRKKIRLGEVDGMPVYSFTSPERRSDINHPHKDYLDVMLAGLSEAYPEKTRNLLMLYLLSHGIIRDDDRKVLSYIRNASHGQSISQITGCGIPVTRVKKSVKNLSEMGLIKQDSRSIAAGHAMNSPKAVFYTIKGQREAIDILLFTING